MGKEGNEQGMIGLQQGRGWALGHWLRGRLGRAWEALSKWATGNQAA